jgi:hypothetical protein
MWHKNEKSACYACVVVIRPHLLTVLASAAILVACHGEDAPAPPPTNSDASEVDTTDSQEVADTYYPDDTSEVGVSRCKLDDGTDPVGLCIQKLVLRHLHEAAFVPKLGVVRSWDSKTFAIDKDSTGAPFHDVHDDVAYGAAIGRYWVRARTYGDTEITATLVGDLVKLSPLVETQLATLPDEYGSDLYANLRQMAAALRYVNENDRAAAIDAIADKYGRAIQTRFFRVLKVDAGKTTDAVLGVASGADTAYASDDVARGALALLDLTVRNPTDPDAPKWQDAARLSLEHLHARARDDKTGLYFRALTTSTDPTHDALSVVSGSTPSDALLTDVQSTVALAMMRAQDMVAKKGTSLALVATYPFEPRAQEILASLNASSLGLWDATQNGYFEGFVPSSSTKLGRKPLRANGLLLAAIHRAFLGKGTVYTTQLKPQRGLLLDRTPPHTSLLSVVPDQQGFFLAVPGSFDFGDPEAGVLDPLAKSYTSASIALAVESLDEQWFGLPE